MSSLLLYSIKARRLSCAAFAALLFWAGRGACQRAPASPDHPWHSHEEQELGREGESLQTVASPVDPAKTYTLADLIDLAETQNPETRVAWQRARAQAATLGIARSQLYPALAATALAEINQGETFFGVTYYRQTIADFDGGLDLSYTVFDFGARSGRISAAKADLLAANFAFNDTHRRVIYNVEHAYFQLLNASGQIDAAEASLTNALAVERAAEDRLHNGLATMPERPGSAQRNSGRGI